MPQDTGSRMLRWSPVRTMLCLLAFTLVAAPAMTEDDPSRHFRDRREGSVPTSLFGTYIEQGELLVYPFYEYETNGEDEYHPSELGAVGEQDFLGKATEHEVLIFLGYGLTESLAVEFEAALWQSATLETAAADMSSLPDRLEENGLGEVEAQLRWRWRRETEERPAYYSFFEVAFPFQNDKLLIGVQDWEIALGTGIIRGFRWGTLNGRLSVAYDAEESEVELGEYAFEYLKRTSERWRFVGTLEGEDDELSLIGEAQWFVKPGIFLKLNSGFGITEKAADWTPEVGVILSF